MLDIYGFVKNCLFQRFIHTRYRCNMIIIMIMIKSLSMSVGFAPPESVSSLTECVAQWVSVVFSCQWSTKVWNFLWFNMPQSQRPAVSVQGHLWSVLDNPWEQRQRQRQYYMIYCIYPYFLIIIVVLIRRKIWTKCP